MNTEILSEKDLLRASELLKAGQIVAFPTETVYGLGACISSETGVKAIFEAKGRPFDNPLIAHLAHFSQWEMVAKEVPDPFFLLAEAFFPGPLTLVVKKKDSISPIVSAGLETIAIRCPSHPLALALIQQVGEPIVAPSANRSGAPSSTTAKHVLADFEGKIPAVVDGGPCVFGLESTVVDLVSFDEPTLLRPGSLKKEAIEAVLKRPLAAFTKGPFASPGMKYRHYSPSIPVRVFSETGAFEQHLSEGLHTYAIPRGKLDGKHLYASLRFADENGYDEIAIDTFGCDDLALLNRLEKMHESDLSKGSR